MNTTERIAIVGAGLVGSLWAVLLRQRGYEVDIYEKRPDLRNRRVEGDRSINLVITSRGLQALKVAGLIEPATRLAVPIRGRMIHSRTGELNYQPYGRDNEFNLSISRLELNRFLIDAAERAGARVHFERELVEADFSQRKLHFRSGETLSTAFYDRLFGTDGAGSLVRKEMIRQCGPNYAEKVEWLEADYVELTMPAQAYQTSNVNSLHIWPRGRHMMMALANLDGSFTVTLYMPRDGEVSFSSLQNEEQVRTFFGREFSDAILLMPHFVKEFLHHPRGRLGTVRLTRWVWRDSVALMGDAAHAIVPFFGQGMNCGFEDCSDFLRLMDDLKVVSNITSPDGPQNWETILNHYNDLRRPNANAIADMAIENWHEMRDKVGDPRFLLRKKVEGLLEDKFPDLFKPRYGLIAYTLVPYREAQAVGRVHDRVLRALCEGIENPDEIDWNAARDLLKRELQV